MSIAPPDKRVAALRKRVVMCPGITRPYAYDAALRQSFEGMSDVEFAELAARVQRNMIIAAMLEDEEFNGQMPLVIMEECERRRKLRSCGDNGSGGSIPG